jgi:hypothetical protein
MSRPLQRSSSSDASWMRPWRIARRPPGRRDADHIIGASSRVGIVSAFRGGRLARTLPRRSAGTIRDRGERARSRLRPSHEVAGRRARAAAGASRHPIPIASRRRPSAGCSSGAPTGRAATGADRATRKGCRYPPRVRRSECRDDPLQRPGDGDGELAEARGVAFAPLACCRTAFGAGGAHSGARRPPCRSPPVWRSWRRSGPRRTGSFR